MWFCSRLQRFGFILNLPTCLLLLLPHVDLLWPSALWFVLQAGQRRPVGWGSSGALFGRVCHCLRLPVWILEQGPAGAVPPGDRQCFTPDVREVLRPRLGVPVPAQPSAHQLCGAAHREPGIHEPRSVTCGFDMWFLLQCCIHMMLDIKCWTVSFIQHSLCLSLGRFHQQPFKGVLWQI